MSDWQPFRHHLRVPVRALHRDHFKYFHDPANTQTAHPWQVFWFTRPGLWPQFIGRNHSWNDYYLEIEVDMSKVAVLSTYSELVDFGKRYGYGNGPDFHKVACDYSGCWVEWDAVGGYKTWAGSWDVTSGCLWDLDALRVLNPQDSDGAYLAYRYMRDVSDDRQPHTRERQPSRAGHLVDA